MTEAQSASSGGEEQMFGAKQQIPGKAGYGRQLERRSYRTALAVQSSPAERELT